MRQQPLILGLLLGMTLALLLSRRNSLETTVPVAVPRQAAAVMPRDDPWTCPAFLALSPRDAAEARRKDGIVAYLLADERASELPQRMHLLGEYAMEARDWTSFVHATLPGADAVTDGMQPRVRDGDRVFEDGMRGGAFLSALRAEANVDVYGIDSVRRRSSARFRPSSSS